MTNRKNMKLALLLKQSYIILFIRLLGQKWQEVLYCLKYMATGRMNNNSRKLETDLTITAHALEKGMAIGKVRIGFGKKKAYSLIKGLDKYSQLKGYKKEFIIEVSSIINKYILFNKEQGADMKDIQVEFEKFCTSHYIELINQGGILTKSKQETNNQLCSDFREFSQSRFSIRDFSEQPISMEAINKALQLCERTPSACNRQNYRIHIFTNKEQRQKLFDMQLGCNGFSDDMQCAILICGDMLGYKYYEHSLLYVDGGLYAMNLLYALHREGLATIPLTVAHKNGYLNRIKKAIGIPDNEIPILLIGVGSYKDKYKVAESHRKDYKSYTYFHS